MGCTPIESAPTGNCTHQEAYQVLGDQITLIGNIQYDLFRSLTPEQMKREVRRTVGEVNGRRFILSPTAGPYEQSISQTVMDNYMAFLDAAAEF